MRLILPILLAAVAVAAQGQSVATPEAIAALPDRPGKAGVVQACSGCHQPDIVLGLKRDAPAWRELVDQMIARGAPVDEARYEEIIAYLAQAS
ncbi:MAG: hypothetical protein KGQ52_04930 [Alphaproteobacteria bacterium]|nr:hypothetical protein [Alphaproteobacteria bacterium]